MTQETLDGIEQKPKYKSVIFFNSSGEVSDEEIRKFSPESLTDSGLVFDSKEEMSSFLENAMSSLRAPNIYLLSTNDYNIGIESCQDMSTFKDIFQRYGNEIVLDEDASESKNFLSKFF
jgi:hypothetical protein